MELADCWKSAAGRDFCERRARLAVSAALLLCVEVDPAVALEPCALMRCAHNIASSSTEILPAVEEEDEDDRDTRNTRAFEEVAAVAVGGCDGRDRLAAISCATNWLNIWYRSSRGRFFGA